MAKTLDPRAERIVLRYLGDESGEPGLYGIPARDLSEADIARLVYAQALNGWDPTSKHKPPDPEKPDQAAATALVALLVERAVYAPTAEPVTPEA